MNTLRRTSTIFRAILPIVCAMALAVSLVGCPPAATSNDNDNTEPIDNENINGSDPNDNGSGNDNDNGGAMGNDAQWSAGFQASGLGFMSAVWGSGPNDVFVVGGQAEAGEIIHYDGATWQQMNVPDVPRLIWVFGFASDNVYSVGEGGTALHYDGSRWNMLETPTDEDLWGVWGNSPIDLWLVGGNTNDANGPIILNFDGCSFEEIVLPAEQNDRNATALFKVWGIGSKVFAVGSDGLIVELDAETREWLQVATGSDRDFVSLWGTSEDNIVAVGGRNTGQIAVYDGGSWTTRNIETLAGLTSGLNSVFMIDSDEALVGGLNGFAATFNPMTDELNTEFSGTNDTIHGMWAGGSDLYHVVGGVTASSGSDTGLALVRTIGDPDPTFGFTPQLPGTLPAAADPTMVFLNALVDPPTVLGEGDEVAYFIGTQGGAHVEPLVRFTGFPAGTELVNITHSLRLIDDDRVISELIDSFAATPACIEEGTYQLKGRRFFLTNDAFEELGEDILALDGLAAEFMVTVELDGVTASATQTLTLVAPEDG